MKGTTERQASACDLVLKGYRQADIGYMMGISQPMVYKHIMAAKTKHDIEAPHGQYDGYKKSCTIRQGHSVVHKQDGHYMGETIPAPEHDNSPDISPSDAGNDAFDHNISQLNGDVSWVGKPYTLLEWAIDATLGGNTCSMCNEPLNAIDDVKYCVCGRWKDSKYGCGKVEPEEVCV